MPVAPVAHNTLPPGHPRAVQADTRFPTLSAASPRVSVCVPRFGLSCASLACDVAVGALLVSVCAIKDQPVLQLGVSGVLCDLA